jgi:hypothetical protein
MNYDSADIAEQFRRTLDRAMLDFAHAAGGKPPLAIIMHVEWVDGGMASVQLPKGCPRPQALVLMDALGRRISQYINVVTTKINTVAKEAGHDGSH